MSQFDQQSLNGSRPKSAVESQRFASQSLGRFFQQQNSALDEKTVSSIWKAFGSYIAKQLRNGKGVAIPKFGNFTFTPTIVDLAGTTNPNERDKQYRDPVFLVGKDFVSGVILKTGMAHNKGAQVRPYDIKGASGIIPKVKINYTEVAALCNQSKDICRNGCEQVFRFLSDKVRKGETVQIEIPFVGHFIVKTGIAAVAFMDELNEETKGVTAKNHFVNKLFASSVNRLNLQIHDQNQIKQNPNFGLGGALRVTGDAETWLKSNLNISVQELVLKNSESRQNGRIQSAHSGSRGMQRYGSLRPEDLKRKSWAIGNNGGLTEQNKQLFDRMSEYKSGPISKRPMSAVTRITTTSRMSNLPEVGRMKLMIIANDIYKNRQSIMDSYQAGNGTLRDQLSSSELLQILKKVGIFIEIGYLKALLKELGFNWNGKSCSLVNLFQKCQQYLYGSTQEEDQTKTYFQTVASPKYYETAPNNTFNYNKKNTNERSERQVEDLIQMVKDLFYSTNKSLYEIYSESRLGNNIDFGGLKKVVQAYSNNSVSDQDIQIIFNALSKGKDSISYQEFEKAFNWSLPSGSEWETRCFRVIRDWMFKNGLSSETTFEMFLKKTNKLLQKRLSRIDFHKAMNDCGFRFSAPEIDGLFQTLDSNQDGELDIDEWKNRIYEDSLNPLQMLREVVQKNKLTPDDILFKMHLRIWDAPLDFPKLCESLRKLDPTLSETQIRHLAKSLKNKDNKVEITALLRNLCGQEYETVDYRNRIFRQIYAEIHPHKEERLIQLLEDADPLNDGRVEPQGLKSALKKILDSVDEESIDRFIRFLDKDKSGKVKYMEFLQRMSEVSNRDHNPFKSVVQRIAYFIENNKQTISSVLRRLSSKSINSDNKISVDTFAMFLKQKIDKKRSEGELLKYAHYMDIDKDGFISEIDLQTCLDNLNSDAFFRNSGEALAVSAFSSAKKFYPNTEKLPEERAHEIAKQIRTSLINQKIAYREAFNRFDQNKDGFLSFTEFSSGIDKVLTLSIPIKEKLFALMDKNQIGLVDYPNFLEVIQLSSASKLKKGDFGDNFDWENNIIDNIKEWVMKERITIEEAFKCFDRDFDGYIKKEDLKWGIINILKIKEEEIFPTKLDRLFRLLDFYKTNSIQLSDFQRLINNENPYSSSGLKGTASTDNFRKSFGGSFAQTSTFDWKLSAIQQIGLVLSKQYSSLKESFEIASEYLSKVTFEQFKKFIEKSQALSGFNMTLPLIQRLFAEIDPHKKGYLTENDWLNAFQSFNYNDQILIELKNAIQCSFSDVDSAFEFFLTFKPQNQQGKKTITASDFEKALDSLTSGRFKKSEVQQLWKQLTENGKLITMDKYTFRSYFDNLRYSGNSSIRKIKTAPPGARTTIVSQSSSSSQWDVDILEKLRQIIRSSSQSFEDIFREFDEDKNGTISQVEFRNAIRKLNLGLTSREIDKIMTKIDTNNDGKIDWREFISKFKTSELDERLKERAKDKMARLKELMMLHMTSPNDAFRFVRFVFPNFIQFDESKLGKLTYQEFSKLVIKVHELAGEKIPTYPIIKDLFDTIDIRKDGILDINEWQQTFGGVIEGNKKLTIRATPLGTWENSREYQQIGVLIAKNRKLLKEEFEKVAKGKYIVNFEQAKIAMLGLLQQHFSGITDDKLRAILRVAELQGGNSEGIGNQYDFMRILDVYKTRHAGPQI